MPDKNTLALALLQQNGYVDVPILLGQNIQVNPSEKIYPIDIPPSRMYRDIILEIGGGLTPGDISEIDVQPLGNTIQEWNPLDLDDVNQYFQAPSMGPDANGTYRLNLSQCRQRLIGGTSYINFDQKTFFSGSAGDAMEATLLNCGSEDANKKSINLLKIRVKVASYAGPATAFLNVLCLAGPSYPGGPGLLKVVSRQTITISAGLVTLTKGNFFNVGDKMHTVMDAIVLVPPDDGLGNQAVFENFQLQYNNNNKIQRLKLDNDFIQQLGGYRTTQAGIIVLDFTETGLGDKSIPIGDPATDLILKFNAADSTPAGALPGTLTGYTICSGYLW